jgi:alkylation response protein AidB-like acyl-CoA dehydrogenase
VDLQLSPEQQQLRDAARRLLAQRLASLVEQLPAPPVHDPSAALRDAQALGWLGLGLPEAQGGFGTFEDLVLVHEELGRGLAPSLVTTLGLAARLVLHADPTHPLLAQLAAGEVLVAVADPFLPGTAARLAPGPDGLRLHGEVPHVVDAHAVSQLLLAASDRLVCLPLDAAGVTVVAEESACDLELSTVRLHDVVVFDGWLVAGDVGGATRALRTEATVLAAARALGGGRAVLERAVAHVSTRHQFGRAIGTFQAVQHQLADVATALDAAGLAVARAAWAVDTGLPDTRAAAAVAGLAAQEAFQHATLVAHQLHGGMGFVLDSPLHLWSARAVADPTAPRGRRHLLDSLADTLRVQPDHRSVAARG